LRRCNPIFCATITKHRFPLAEKEIMANLSKLIFGAAIAATSISTPALAAHNGKPISAHHKGCVRGNSQRTGVYNVLPSRGPSPSCPGLPYCDPDVVNSGEFILGLLHVGVFTTQVASISSTDHAAGSGVQSQQCDQATTSYIEETLRDVQW